MLGYYLKKRKKRNHKGSKTINHSQRVLFEVVFTEVWQFKYKSFMSYFRLKKKIHDPEFFFAIISVLKDGRDGKDGTGKETDSILWPFIRIYWSSKKYESILRNIIIRIYIDLLHLGHILQTHQDIMSQQTAFKTYCLQRFYSKVVGLLTLKVFIF